MHFDAYLYPSSLNSIPAIANAAERMGFSALWTTETRHDPFLPAALIAEHTKRLSFGTAVAISFARSPATLAYTAWDLSQASEGRFILGLGTQVRAHIERRFGMPWPDSVVGKLREQVSAIRAFWQCWQNGTPLNFRGAYYKLTLMSPFFNPGSIEHPSIPIYLAGVNPGLMRLAGEVADGFHVHPLHSAEYLRRVILPSIEQGAARVGRKRSDIHISVTAFVVTNAEDELNVRTQIAFYASTPSYRPVLALHGWEGLGEQLSALAARSQWDKMPDLINDEMLETLAVVAPTPRLAKALLDRYEWWADRLTLYLPFFPGERDEFWRTLLAEMPKSQPSTH